MTVHGMQCKQHWTFLFPLQSCIESLWLLVKKNCPRVLSDEPQNFVEYPCLANSENLRDFFDIVMAFRYILKSENFRLFLILDNNGIL